MMKFWEKIGAYTPMLATVFVIACVVISLHGYVAPVYAVQVPETEQAAENDKKDEKETEIVETVETEQQMAKGTFDVEDGTYEGSGTGFHGTIKVAVKIKDHTITGIDILSSQDDEAFFNRAKGVINQMISKQSLDVDVVSGATYSSRGIIIAVKNALTGEVDNNEPAASESGTGAAPASVSQVEETGTWKDGTYYGSGTGFAGTIKVQVVIQDGQISAIEITDTSDDSSYINSASAVIAKMLSAQSTNVDTVSGATYSSAGIINAVRDALSDAAVSGTENEEPNSETEDEKEDETDEQEPDVTGTIPYRNGIYFGVGEGYLGDVEVCIVIQENTIKTILVTEAEDDEAFFNKAKSVIDAVMKKQTTDVDTISGATFSSNGILEAINDALAAADAATNGGTDETEQPGESDVPDETEQPGGSDASDGTDEPDEPLTIYADGEYTGIAVCEPDVDGDFEAYNLSLKITVENDKIVAVTDIAGDGDAGNDSYIRRAANGTSKLAGVAAQIIARGMPDNIDTVSRATCSSKSIIEACLQALESAAK